jgi:hypothetical protein
VQLVPWVFLKGFIAKHILEASILKTSIIYGKFPIELPGNFLFDKRIKKMPSFLWLKYQIKDGFFTHYKE